MVYGMQKILRRTFLQEIDGPLVTDDEDQPACSLTINPTFGKR
jgi:hypothetical protein